MKRKMMFLALVLVAALTPLKLKAATNCYPAYQSCVSHCSDQTCRNNCWDWYNACRLY